MQQQLQPFLDDRAKLAVNHTVVVTLHLSERHSRRLETLRTPRYDWQFVKLKA